MMFFFFLPLLFLIPLAIFWIARPASGMGCGMQSMQAAPPTQNSADPVEIARLRLARGEITPAEYDEIRRILG